MSRRLFIESLFDRGLVDEHYRDVVADRVNTFTFDALQRVPIGLQFDLRFAGRTRKYFQKFLTDCHALELITSFSRILTQMNADSLSTSAAFIYN